MKPNETNTPMDKIKNGLGLIKAALTKDYSWQDIKAWIASRADQASTANAESSNSGVGKASSSSSDPSNLPLVLMAVAERHRMLFIALLCIVLFTIASQLWLLPLTQTIQAQLELRPAQWAQLQHVLKVNHAISAASMGVSSTRARLVTPLNESEMQKVRAVLEARDIKPNILRLSNDNPPRLELQANDVLFSAWIEVLEELRQVWRLYPENVSAIASANPGVVQLSSSLKQIQVQQQSQSQSQSQSLSLSSASQSGTLQSTTTQLNSRAP
jgi:hypothetical protein